MENAEEVRDDFVNHIYATKGDDDEDEESLLIGSAVLDIEPEGDNAFVLTYQNGKVYRVTFSEVK